MAHSLRLTTLLAGLCLSAGASQAATLTVAQDQVRTITFASPVKTVFVGNPAIADVTVIDNKHVFLLGKSFGSTNLIALDGEGNQMVNDQVTVNGRPGSMVTVQRGAAQSTLSCDGERCEPTPKAGDDATTFDAVTGQVVAREALNAKAAGGQ